MKYDKARVNFKEHFFKTVRVKKKKRYILIIPCINLRNADVMKMLIISSNITLSNNWSGDSNSWHAIIINAYKQKKKLSNIGNHSIKEVLVKQLD